MQTNHTDNRGCERCGNLRVAHIGDVGGAPGLYVMNLGMERGTHLAGGAGETDRDAAWIDHIDGKSMRLNPASNLLNIGSGRAVLRTELFGRQPAMIS